MKKNIFVLLLAAFFTLLSCSSDPRERARHYNERINNASNLTELSYATKSMRDYYYGLNDDEKKSLMKNQEEFMQSGQSSKCEN